jgi:hypothetical protein
VVQLISKIELILVRLKLKLQSESWRNKIIIDSIKLAGEQLKRVLLKLTFVSF